MRRAALAAALALAVPAAASAHVDVLPVTITEGEATQFTVRVPNERPGLSTTAVRVVFPSQVTVFSFAPPPPGWTMQVQSAANGRISGVTYRGRLEPERYQDFAFLGNAFATGKGVWKAFQTYSDGKVKPWTTPPAADEDTAETGPTDPGPGYTIPDEGEGFTYVPGQLVMARSQAPNSASAQFFFTAGPNASALDEAGTYVVFGNVIEGLDIVESILASSTGSGSLGGQPDPTVIVTSVQIEELAPGSVTTTTALVTAAPEDDVALLPDSTPAP